MFGNLKDMMGKMHEAQQQAEEIKKKLDTTYVRESTDDIAITVTGNKEIKDLEISDRLLEDKEELQDLLVISLNRALEKAHQLHEEEMKGVAKGMLPGMDLFK